MTINNIEKQYNKDLDNLKKKIELLKNTLNQYNKIPNKSVSCNSDYRIPPVLENGIYNIVSIAYPDTKLHAVGCWTGKQEDCRPALWGNDIEVKWKFIRIRDNIYNIVSKAYPDKKLHAVDCWAGPEKCRPALWGNDIEAEWIIVKISDNVYNIVSKAYPDKKLHVVDCWAGPEKCRPALSGNDVEAEWNIINLDNNNNNKAREIMCPKNLPKCLKTGNDDSGICMSEDSNLENLENEILTLNNDIVNSFVKLNDDYKKYKNSPEMIKISKEIKLLNTIQDLQVEKELLKMEKEEDITNNFGSRENIFKSENRYYNYLLLVVILVLYSIYGLYRGENYDNIDYIILFLILLYVAYVAYMTFYK